MNRRIEYIGSGKPAADALFEINGYLTKLYDESKDIIISLDERKKESDECQKIFLCLGLTENLEDEEENNRHRNIRVALNIIEDGLDKGIRQIKGVRESVEGIISAIVKEEEYHRKSVGQDEDDIGKYV